MENVTVKYSPLITAIELNFARDRCKLFKTEEKIQLFEYFHGEFYSGLILCFMTKIEKHTIAKQLLKLLKVCFWFQIKKNSFAFFFVFFFYIFTSKLLKFEKKPFVCIVLISFYNFLKINSKFSKINGEFMIFFPQ